MSTMTSRAGPFDGAVRWAPFVACAAILAVKIPLLWRINVNWDEFYYLSHVYSGIRGDLPLLFQTAHVHLFRWLTWIQGGEVAQIVAARSVMLVLLAVTSLLIWRLAARWTSPAVAAFAPLAYLASSAVLRHGDAFRADSMLATLSVATLLLFTRRTADLKANAAAGFCFGVALALTVKAALLTPVLLSLAILGDGEPAGSWSVRARMAARRLLTFGLFAAGTAGVILLLHTYSLGDAIAESPGQFAARATGKTLLQVPFFPRADYFKAIVFADVAGSILIGLGALAAIVQRRYAVAVLGLSLLPVLFYRNSFPYYYVVMLAPACVLAAVGTEAVLAFVRRTLEEGAARRIMLLVLITLAAQAAVHLFQLRTDNQSPQRATLAAVHRIFPQPVPYIDHSGMVASFPKVNFFMSSWGMQEYRAGGKGFMREAMARFRPPLLVANREMLDPQSGQFRAWLLPEDQDLITRYFLPYWGLIFIAGAESTLASGAEVRVSLPYAGRYRLDAPQPVFIDGKLHKSGDVLEFGPNPSAAVRMEDGDSPPIDVRFYWAAAAAPPAEAPPEFELYLGL